MSAQHNPRYAEETLLFCLGNYQLCWRTASQTKWTHLDVKKCESVARCLSFLPPLAVYSVLIICAVPHDPNGVKIGLHPQPPPAAGFF